MAVALCCVVACTDGRDVRPGDAGSGGQGQAGAPAPIGSDEFTLATEVLAPLAGPSQRRAPGQEALRFYGTDLGYTFNQGDELRILFGDTVVMGAPPFRQR